MARGEAAAAPTGGKLAFVTVGTTRFDALVQAVTAPAALAALGARGFTRLVLQIGASPQPSTGAAMGSTADNDAAAAPGAAAQQSSWSPSPSSSPRRRSRRLSWGRAAGGAEGKQQQEERQGGQVAVGWYRYKDSLRPDMEAADLIISHAGAGSVMEALALEKPLVVVVNAALMDDHQQELAHAMEEQGFLVATDPARLVATLQARAYEGLAIRPPPTPGLLPGLLDEEMGFVGAAATGAVGLEHGARGRRGGGGGGGAKEGGKQQQMKRIVE